MKIKHDQYVISLGNTQQRGLSTPPEPEHADGDSKKTNSNETPRSHTQTLGPLQPDEHFNDTSDSCQIHVINKHRKNRNGPLTLLRTTKGAEGDEQHASQEKVDRFVSGFLFHVPASGGSSE